MEMYHSYAKPRREFGRHPKFVDEGAEMLADIRPNEEHANEYIERNPVTSIAQVVPEMSEHEANTNAVIYTDKVISHYEGGWPKEVDFTEAEHVIRYRKKIEKDEEYINTVVRLGGSIEDLIKQNNAIDIYEEYWGGKGADHSHEPPSVKTITVFRDPNAIKRGVSYIAWHPDPAVGKVVASYSILEFQQQPEGMCRDSYIWDLHNPNSPEFELRPLSQICVAHFNNKDSNVIGAGQYNGQLALFDIRKGNRPTVVTQIENSHRDPVFDMSWTQSKTGTEAMTCSTDGMVLWWDTRNLSEPMEPLPLIEKGGTSELGALSLEYNPAAGPTKFMVGTEAGVVLSCNRKAKNPQDRVGASFGGHHGPVVQVERHPFYPKYFLTIADWSARTWTEDLRTPIIATKYHQSYMTGGTWSPGRPGVFFTIHEDGKLDVWDYFFKQNDPALSVQITDVPLQSIRANPTGKRLALGAKNGSCTMLELNEALSEQQANEKLSISNMFERETNREKNLEKAIKEARMKAKKEASKGDAVKDPVTEEELSKIETDFMEATKPQPGDDDGHDEIDDLQVSGGCAPGGKENEANGVA
uniref:Dynein intermediate chain 2, axonemal n=1 Tax=Tetraselmis sp. GSL018 TaxID=582737 RepID=A0A061RDX4_9CHLO|mmetsp:Transcript_8826/g.21320  ORF Transcript_8826/g.21320 Transcript_8826/m.21320 type:complete len:584 (+) Transcript_8826:210-1961(+)|eukprot:CAMPEP_0177582294 /NCGR_PEP_ID=MMETSP0419_2-20121207/2654_1 /TAXON_ID=582737 /ORGANISM="Tetraselmis sp., Strain GSL018" /LENGTH=583 /DNA_ID=CAMNT_0019071493 /DNA_START=195 /DNA_END=1946 /DNA_ORIENTATION=+